jgi:regulator of cell morphogenesis and NO signaling
MTALVKRTVGEIAAANPHAATLFDIVGIDYCCHGNLTLRDACAAAGLSPIEIRDAAQRLPRDVSEKSWLDERVTPLVEHLRGERHPALRRLLTHAAAVFAEACQAAVPRPVELDQARVLFHRAFDRIHPHLIHEEHVILPVIEHLEECWEQSEKPSMTMMGGLHRPMALMLLDHEEVLSLIARTRALVDALPANEGNLRLRDALEAADHELRQCVHLENNILFPRARALEAAVNGLDPAPRATCPS